MSVTRLDQKLNDYVHTLPGCKETEVATEEDLHRLTKRTWQVLRFGPLFAPVCLPRVRRLCTASRSQ